MNRAIDGILITPETVVACDSFRLLEVKVKTNIVKNIVVECPKEFTGAGETITWNDGILTEDNKKMVSEKKGCQNYPEYENFFPKTEPNAVIMVSSELLSELLKTQCKIEKNKRNNNRVVMKVYSDKIVIEGTRTRSIIMNITK